MKLGDYKLIFVAVGLIGVGLIAAAGNYLATTYQTEGGR